MENILIAFRFLLSGLISDNPEWIAEQMFNQQNRVKQMKETIDEKELQRKINPASSGANENFGCIDIVDDVMM